MEANPCLLCLSANSEGGNVRKVSSLLNLVRAVQLTNVVPGDDDGGFVFCNVCDQLLDSATAISNSISQLQIKLRTKIDDIREIILNSEGNFGDSGCNLNVEISKTRKSFLECSGNDDKATISEFEKNKTGPEAEEDDVVLLADKNMDHDPSTSSASEANDEMEIEETEIKSGISEPDYFSIEIEFEESESDLIEIPVQNIGLEQNDQQRQQLPIVNNAHLNSSSIVPQPMSSPIQVPRRNSATNSDLNNINSPRHPAPRKKNHIALQEIYKLQNKNKNSQPTMQSPGPNLIQNGQQSSGTPSPSPAAAVVTPRPPENPLPPPNRQRKCPGMFMLCKYCGQISEDMHYCERCKRRIPDDAKIITNTNTKRSRKQRLVPKPPQEIVLSPDEDEPDPKLPKTEPPTKSPITTSYSDVDGCIGNSGIVQKAISDFDVYDDEINFQELTSAIESVAANSSPSDPCLKVLCRSVRVGDYQCNAPGGVVTMFTVYITKLGIMFTIPEAKKLLGHRPRLVKCAIPMNAIVSVECHTSRKLCVLFIDTGPEYAKYIRKHLGLSEDPKSEGAFFCPSNGDQYQKRITLVPDEAYSSESTGLIYKIFGRAVTTLDFPAANKALVKLFRPSVSSSPSKPSTNPSKAIPISVLVRNPNSAFASTSKVTVLVSSKASNSKGENKTVGDERKLPVPVITEDCPQ